MEIKVAFLGSKGSFSEQAAICYNSDADLHPFPSISGVALSVVSGIVDEGVVPIENSLEGSVNDTLDMLINQPELSIRRELVIPIEHCLLTLSNTRAADIQIIYSHPQALGQCRGFLERCFPGVQLMAALSTSAAVNDMINSTIPSAAIGSERLSDKDVVEVLASGIQDNATNLTRFVVLANGDHDPTGNDKTSICLAFPDDRPGLLISVLGEFSSRDINLAKVESRPTKQTLGEYLFLIDLHGHRDDGKIKEAFAAVKSQTSVFRIFGSYPRWVP